MSLVVDASVVSKWVLVEEGTDRAIKLRGEVGLIAPSLLASEVGNALWKAVRRGEVARSDAVAAMGLVLLPFDRLVPNEELHMRALHIAMDLKHPIYDCFYLALAEREAATLVTADGRLLAAARKGKFGVKVKAL